MNTAPLVTIIIPTYNRAAILPAAIKSVLAQSYTNVQVIVVDDGSADNTAEVVGAYAQVEYYLIEHGGQAAARNGGLAHAKGDYIATLDSDDVWEPEFLTRCITKLEDDGLDLVFANWFQNYKYNGVVTVSDYLTNNLNIRPFIKDTPDHWVNLTYQEARLLYLICCPSPSSSAVMRRSSIVSTWNKQMRIGDDWCMYLDMILSKECKVAFLLEPMWEKKVDVQNIYDGRIRHEVLRELYVHDLETMAARFRHLLSPAELYIFQKLYMEGSVELAKHEIVRGLNFKEAARLLGKSFSAHIPYTLKMIPYVITAGLRRRIRMLQGK